jgi:hypothetical protein
MFVSMYILIMYTGFVCHLIFNRYTVLRLLSFLMPVDSQERKKNCLKEHMAARYYCMLYLGGEIS